MDISKALDMWIEITGVNPNDTTIRMRDLDIRHANDIVKKSLEFDTTNVTALMLLERYLDEFLEERKLTLKEIIEGYDNFSKWLLQIHEFRSVLNSNEAIEVKTKFKQNLKDAIAHYKLDESAINLMIENENNLAELRYSAFHAIAKLEVLQFSQGNPSMKKPKIHDKVYMFKDINTLLEWMMSVESGIVLAMIHDSSSLSSAYFVFAIRNGGTLSIVTDRERTVHPLQEEKSRLRARGREFHNRIYQFFFPYSLLNFEVGDNHRAYIDEDESITLQGEGISLSEIQNLEPDEIVWLIMMFSLLSEKFFENNFMLEDISYTGKMMREANLLLNKAEEHSIILNGYQDIEVKKLSSTDMETKNLMDAFDFEPTGQHDWMIERYPVPEKTFDVLSHDHTILYLLNEDAETKNRKAGVTIRKLPVGAFADKKRLELDRIYLARYNQAKAINKQLSDEYHGRKDEVQTWLRQAIKKNLPNLMKSIANGLFFVKNDLDDASTKNGVWVTPRKDGNILRVSMLKGESNQQYTPYYFGGESTTFTNNTCIINDTQAALVAHFHPTTASMLANLCGCEINQLHELLCFWRSSRIHSGNDILNRIDPMDWVIKNHWEDLNLDIRVFISKTGFNQLCKEYKTGNEKFWLKKQDNL
jgi:hypothetical protein